MFDIKVVNNEYQNSEKVINDLKKNLLMQNHFQT